MLLEFYRGKRFKRREQGLHVCSVSLLGVDSTQQAYGEKLLRPLRTGAGIPEYRRIGVLWFVDSRASVSDITASRFIPQLCLLVLASTTLSQRRLS